MPQRSDSETVIARLRAHGLVPSGTTVRLVSGHRGAAKAAKCVWRAVDGVSGRPLGIASRTAMRTLAAQRRWAISRDGDTVFVEPDPIT